MGRSEDSTTITISLSVRLRDEIDARAKELGIDRSTYLRQVCQREFGLPAMVVNEPRAGYRIVKKSKQPGSEK